MARLRVEKLQEAIKQEISKILLHDIKDPRIKFVTEAWQGLNKAVGYMRTEIAKRIRLRFAPVLIFTKDTSMEYSAHIEELLRKIKQEETQHE